MPIYEMSDPSPDQSISYPSKGPILDSSKQQITNGHSIYTDVNGAGVWLHATQHHHDGSGRVHMTLSHAVDMGLETPYSEPKKQQFTVVESDKRPSAPSKVKSIKDDDDDKPAA